MRIMQITGIMQIMQITGIMQIIKIMQKIAGCT